MWGKSKPNDYLSFRVFIFGVTSQSMFPNGVIYEGIEDNKPLHFRGESGANDSIVSQTLTGSLDITPTDIVQRSPFWTTFARSLCP